LDPYACYYGLIWSEWNKWVEYGYSTRITTFKVQVGASYDYICERWRQQFDMHYAPSLIINLWGFSKFMKVVVLGMWCLKHVSATNGNKVFKGLVQVNVKDVHVALQKMITLWIKKSKKGRQEWEKACIQCGMPPRKLKTVIKTKFASKSSCLRRLWNSSKQSSHVMEGRILSLYNKEFQKPKCGPL